MAMFHILGPVRLHVHGRIVDLGATKIRGLLGILLLSANVGVPIDTIVTRLWDRTSESPEGTGVQGREPPSNPHKTLQGYVSRLRSVLARAQTPAQLVTEHGQYRLKVNATTVDYHHFRELADEGLRNERRSDHEGAVAALGAAVELWRGQPLADVQSSWSQRYADTLTNQDLLPAYYCLFRARLALGRHEEVLAQLRPLLATYETDENFVEFQMRAMAEVDGPSSIVGCFHDFTDRLRDTFGTRPTERLTELYRQLTNFPRTSESSINQVTIAEPRRPRPFLLPRDILNFIGRNHVLQTLDELLDSGANDSAVVTLDGQPGVGKTALATRWGHRRRDSFPDGQLYVDLNGYGPGSPTDPATALATLLDALGVPPEHMPNDVHERAALIRHELLGRRVLVILDNAFDSAHIGPLLTATDPSPVLITSRQKLSLLAYRHGAHSITVPTLMSDESIALLGRRISDTHFRNDLPAIKDLAALCGGLPLGLQIVGEHVAARPDVPLRDLVQHLRSRRRLLYAGGHGDSGSNTLHAVFDWSCNGLPEGADRLFRFLGLHPSTHVSTQAAAAVGGLSARETEYIFDVLVGAHLVHQQDTDSYRIHDLLHLYAAERAQEELSAADREEAVHRMADWYLHTTIDAISKLNPDGPSVPFLAKNTGVAHQTFPSEDAAIRWCIRERRQIIAVCRYAADYGFHSHVWRMAGVSSDVLTRYGDPHDLLDVHQIALQAARIAGARDGEAGILNNIGGIEFSLENHENSARYFAQALTIFREIDDERGESVTLFNLGNTRLERGSLRGAIELHELSLAISERLDDKLGQASVFHRLGEAYQRLDRPEVAADYYQRSLSIHIQLKDSRGQAATLAKMAELSVEGNDPARAISLCDQALVTNRRTLDQRRTAETLSTRARAYYQLGDHDHVITSAREAAAAYHAIGHSRGEARALDLQAQAHAALGHDLVAERYWQTALRLFDHHNDPRAFQVRELLERNKNPEAVPEPRTTPLTYSKRGLPTPKSRIQQPPSTR